MNSCLRSGVGLAAMGIGLVSQADAAQYAYLWVKSTGDGVVKEQAEIACRESPVGKTESWVEDNCTVKRADSGTSFRPYLKIRLKGGVFVESR